MKRARIHVSDHALIRYMERVLGMDLEYHRAEIARTVDAALEHEGACGIVSGGFRYKLQGLTVSTVLPANEPNFRTGRVKR